MECNRETVKFDCFDTRNITVKVSAKELLEEGAKLLGVPHLPARAVKCLITKHWLKGL